ncbi:MAG: ParB N-terminal domain-containing protein [Sphingomonadaceae bacterium]|nr:ParB N-terminal domain-containing protein [Sphingomonadaceae bacterium]
MNQVLSLDPFTIDPDEAGRIGLFFPAKAEALGFLMQRDGQTDPIKVTKAPSGSNYEWKLVYGLHRLRGALSAGIDVKAVAVEGSKAELEAIQASENINRRELEPLERALFVHAVASAAQWRVMNEHGVKSAQALGGKAKANKVQYSEIEKADEIAEAAGDNLSLAYGWANEAAEALGLGKRDLQRSMRIHRLIIQPFPELIDPFKDHPVAKVADSLLKIASIKDALKRKRVIEILIAGPNDLGFAMQSAGVTDQKPEPTPYTKFSSQMLGAWSRLGTADKRRFIPDLAAAIPAGMRKTMREELDRLDSEQGTDA